MPRQLQAGFFLFFLSVVVSLGGASEALAQTPSITLNGSSTTVRESDEFFTDAFGDPADFNSTCDLGFDQWKVEPKTASNGIVTITHPDNSGPILGVVPIPTTGTNLAVTREDCAQLTFWGKEINSAKYTAVSWKVRNSYAGFDDFWSFLYTKDNNYAINGFGGANQWPGGGYLIQANTWQIQYYSITGRQPANYPWTGPITGISFWPTGKQPAGGTSGLDWFRIYDPTTGANVSINWNSSGDTAQDSVTVYVDNNNSGFDGIPIDRPLASDGSLSFDTGRLAPGTYFLYAQLERSGSPLPVIRARSNYIGPVTVNAKPLLKFTSPSRMSGMEYARDERGDPWDMNSLTDTANLQYPDGNPQPEVFHGLQAWRVENGVFFGTTKGSPVSGQVDSQVHFTVAPARPVDTNFYRYFCYKMAVDPVHLPRNGDAAGLNLAGWVARFVWYRQGSSSFGTTAAHELVEKSSTFYDANGFVTYCFDLWDERGFETGIRWRTSRFINVVRFDPLEATPATEFAIDQAGLYAENFDTEGREYRIAWNATDLEGGGFTVSLFYDTDRSGFDGVSIGTFGGQVSGNASHIWNTNGVPNGPYYIYAVVTDGAGNTGRYYSDVVVNVGGLAGRSAPAAVPCDSDGDGKSDPQVVRANAGNANATAFTLNSGNGVPTTAIVGNTLQYSYPSGDYDGDFLADQASYLTAFTLPTYYRTHSSNNQTFAELIGGRWSLALSADFDGDGVSDRSTFNAGIWTIVRSALSAIQLAWGGPGDIPVPADYDGDGLDDVAVYRPSEGKWYILPSTLGAVVAWVKQHGAPGDHPMPGDYNGDGRDDIAIWRNGDGYWWICYNDGTAGCSSIDGKQFGLPGDTPVRFDRDGDGKRDLAVFRGGYWLIRLSSTEGLEVVPFGLPGDLAKCASGTVENAQVELQKFIASQPPPPRPRRRRR